MPCGASPSEAQSVGRVRLPETELEKSAEDRPAAKAPGRYDGRLLKLPSAPKEDLKLIIRFTRTTTGSVVDSPSEPWNPS